MKNERLVREGQKLPPVSEQMKAWSASLAAEVADWPHVRATSYFGFTAFYRGANLFGMLPRTRSFGKGSLLAFRIDRMPARVKTKLVKDPRIGFIDPKNTRWFTFELTCDADLHQALDWFGEAHQCAARRRNSKK